MTNNPDTQPMVTEADKAAALEACPILPTEKHDMTVATARSAYRRGYARALADARHRTQQTARSADVGREALEAAIAGLWLDILEKDDRTSPEEYPDMALITEDEFAASIRYAAALTPPTDEPLQDGGLREMACIIQDDIDALWLACRVDIDIGDNPRNLRERAQLRLQRLVSAGIVDHPFPSSRQPLLARQALSRGKP